MGRAMKMARVVSAPLDDTQKQLLRKAILDNGWHRQGGDRNLAAKMSQLLGFPVTPYGIRCQIAEIIKEKGGSAWRNHGEEQLAAAYESDYHGRVINKIINALSSFDDADRNRIMAAVAAYFAPAASSALREDAAG